MKVTFERILLQLGLLIGGGGILALLIALISQAAFDKSVAIVTRAEVKCEVTWKGPKNTSGADIINCDEQTAWRNQNPRATYRVEQVELADIAFALASGDTHHATVRLRDFEAEGSIAGDELTVLFHESDLEQLRGSMSWMTLLKFFSVILLGGAILFADSIMQQVEKAAERMPAPRPATNKGATAGNRHRSTTRRA